MDISWLLFSLKGRISRKPYWLFVGATILFGLVLVSILSGSEGAPQIISVVSLFLLWPSLAVQVKRWHDRDKSAWWILINIVPVIGPLWVLIELGMLSGTPGENRFGAQPNMPP